MLNTYHLNLIMLNIDEASQVSIAQAFPAICNQYRSEIAGLIKEVDAERLNIYGIDIDKDLKKPNQEQVFSNKAVSGGAYSKILTWRKITSNIREGSYMTWYAIYTKPKHEDAVALRLKGVGLETLSPKIKIKKYKKYKLVEDIEPFFPCYIFAKFDAQMYHHMISYTRGVRYIVGRKNPASIQDEIIESLLVSTEDGVIILEPPELKEGDRVRIKGGALNDFCGIFKKHLNGGERVAVLLEAIGYKVEVNKFFIAKL